jgi:predicted mannosyl-3-phosphoglycerate phosphatase (HAD superfamily)
MLRTVLAGRVRPMAPPSMIVLADARLFCHAGEPRDAASDPAVRTLISHGVPLILASAGHPEEVRAAQASLGVHAPFISSGGAELHVPGGYFEEMLRRPPRSHDWNVIEFAHVRNAPDFSKSIQLLLLLYWNHREDGLVVGVSDRDEPILTHADVAILVRNPALDQQRLRAAVPHAYYTSAAGIAGWAEGILGPVGR